MLFRSHIILAIGNDTQFAKFCEIAECAHVSGDARFASNAQRVRHREVLIPMLEAVMRTRRKQDWLHALEMAHVPCGPINNLAEVFADPHIRSRDMVTTWQHPASGPVELVSSPIKLSATPVRRDMPPPLLGQHTEQVLQEVLHLSADELATLRNKHII